MDYKKITFTSTDVVKIIGFVGFVGTMWFDLKTNQIKVEEKQIFLQYQVDELKKLVAIKPEIPAVKTFRTVK